MPNVPVIDLNNNQVGSLDLADAVFGAPVNEDLIYEAVRWQLACERAGTHQVKSRAEVQGSGKKLWRQKGTGRARMGSIRSPLWRHGGTVNGPVPRDYSYRLPKKMLLGALRSALSAKLRDGELAIVSKFELADHKTKTVAATLAKLGNGAKSALIVESGDNVHLTRGARNLSGVKAVATREVTVYDLLGHQRVLLSEAAARKLSEALA